MVQKAGEEQQYWVQQCQVEIDGDDDDIDDDEDDDDDHEVNDDDKSIMFPELHPASQ